MSTLTFADTHNMVAFLEKPAESDGFHEIIDFLNANQIRYALTVNPTIYTSCIQQFWATAKAKTVNGERQIQALIDKKKVIITETSIRSDLHLEDAGGTDCLPTATIFEELARMGSQKNSPGGNRGRTLQLLKRRHNNMTVFLYLLMIHLSVIRIQKLERKKKSRTTGLQRLRKVGMSRRVKSSEDKDSLGNHKDASKQGRSIEYIDKDADQSAKVREVNTSVEDSAAPTTIKEITLAQTLIQIKAAKPKVVTTAATTTTTRPKARGVVVQEPSEFRTPQESQPSKIKDKGKAIMIEPEVPLKRKDQVALDEDLARNLQAQLETKLIEEERLARKQEEEANIALIESWDNTQAMIEADFELAQRLQTEEQGEISIEERSRLFVELMNKRKKHFAMLSLRERRKPPTKSQKRNLMSTYLKNRVVKSKKEIDESSKGTKNELESDKLKKAESSEEKAKGSKKKILEEVEVDDEAELKKHLLWGDLKVMFEPDKRSDVWRILQGYRVTIWKLIDSSGVHFVRRNLKIQKMNIKFRGGLLGLKRLHGFLEVTTAQHEEHLGLVLELLKKEKLYANLSKCEFWLQEVQFLGHVINGDGIHVNPSKIEVVKNWEAPRTPSKTFDWGEEQENVFQTLKDKLCNAPVLALPDGPKDFVVYCDASGLGLGCVLMQRGKVIAYVSRQLKIHEKNYTTHDFELGAVVFALKIWRHYLYGTKSVIYTDHKSLQHIFIPGKVNVVADALSRKERVKPKRVKAINMTLQLSIKDRILAAQKEAFDESAGLQKGLDKMIDLRNDGGLYYLDRIWVPLKGDMRTLIIDKAYKLKYSVHPGADRMYYDVRDRYWWPGMKKDIAMYAEVREGHLIGHELVQETTEKISQIKDRLKAARDRQKSYADKRRKPLEFSLGDYVLLKVSPWKGMVRFGKMGKLAPRFVGPFEIIEKVGPIAYRLDLHEDLDGVHDTFHVSNLKKCLADPTLQVPLDEIRVDDKLNFMEEPMEIKEREFKKLKRGRIAIVKVRWNSKRGPEFTWECEDQMKLKLKKTVKAVARFLDRVNRALGTGLIGKRVGNVLQQKTEAIRCFGTSIVVEETGSTVRDDGGDR
ncbi:putative reverse transcriptase domain-containing protein [Tanacetum coccineum]